MPLPSPKFPTSVAAAADLLLQINRNASQFLPTLASGMAPGDTSFTVATGTGSELPTDNFVVTIDNEIIFVTSRAGDVCTVGTRGFEGTTAASHNSGAVVNAFITALAHNQLASEINSVESQLGAGMKNVATVTGAADGQVPIFNAAQQQFIPGDPIVSGPDAPGTAPTRNPVQIGGFDGTNVRRISTDTSGKLQIGLPANAAQETGGNLALLAGTVSGGTIVVSGTVTVNQGSANATPWNENISQWGGTAVQAAAAAFDAGTGAQPLVRSTPRRFGQILTTTPLAANASFTSAWFDTNQTGDMYIESSVRSDQSGANPALFLEQTDDSANVGFVSQIGDSQVFANSLGSVSGVAGRRFWRVRYVNGPTLQTTFELTACSYPGFPFGTTFQGGQQPGAIVIQQNWTQGELGDASPTTTPVQATQSGNASFGSMATQVFPFLYNGGSWDRYRTPIIFKTIAAVAVTAGTPQAIWTPTSGKKFRVMGFMLSLSVAGSVILKDATTEILRTPLMAAGIGLASPPMGNGILSAAANNVLNADVSASGSVSGFVYGTEE